MHIKKLILFLFLVPVFASAQKTTGANYTYIAQRYEWLAGVFKALGLPAGDSAQFQPGQEMRAGAVYYDSVGVDSGLYVWSGLAWIEAGGYTDADARAAISLTTTGVSWPFTYNPVSGVFNIPITPDGWYNIVRDGGADTTGATDVSAIIQNAIAIGWRNIFIPKGIFLISTQVQMHDSVTIMGAGRFASVFKLTTDITAFKCSYNSGGNNATFSNIGFYGDYATGGLTTQMGVAIDSAKRILITEISGINMGGFVVDIKRNGVVFGSYPYTASTSNTITDSYFEANYGGVNFGPIAEYNLISNSTFSTNRYAIQVIGGNNRVSSNSVVNNTYGLYMTSGANGGHGLATNNTFNHNGTSAEGANIYMSNINLGFNFSNNSFGESAEAGPGRFEIISCADITWEGGYTPRDTIRVTSSTNIIFSNLRKYTSFSPIWVTVSGQSPTVVNTGKVNNSITITDVVNSKQVDVTHLNGKVNFTGTSGIKFGFLNAAADSTVDITGSLKATGGVRFTGLPTAVGTKAVRVDANGTLSIADTTTGGGTDDSAYHRMQSVNDTTVVFHSNIAADTLVIRAGTSGSIGLITHNWFDDDLTIDGVTTKINRADFFDDMLTTPTSTAGTSYMLELVSGTGADASIGNTAGTPPDGSGWSVLSTGTTTTGAAGLASTSGTISKLKVDTTKTYRFETKLNIETLSDDTEDFRIVAGFCSWTVNTTGTNLIWFRYNDNTNSGNWTCYSADGTTTESTNSGIAAVAGTSVILAFEYDNAAIRYYINGSLVATHTTRLPQHDASTSFPVISVTKTLGSTARLIYFDYVKYRRL